MNKLYRNDVFFLVCVLMGAIGRLLYSIVQMIYFPEFNGSSIIRIIRVICLVCLYISYKGHHKNTMKGMMGAILMAQVISSMNWMSNMNNERVFAFAPIFMVLSVVLFVNHFLINETRTASPVNIRINQIVAVLLTINTAAWSIYLLPYSGNAVNAVSEIIDIFGNAGFFGAIVCVESRLDAYRLDREAAGWTEEKGYPEGYIHEYEKSQLEN